MYKRLNSKTIVLTAFLFFILLMGCNLKEANPYNFPDYVFTGKLPGTLQAYEYAVEAEEGVLEHIPCYCNCQMDPFAHKNVRDCFINSELSTEDEFVYDKHGYG